MSTLLIIDDDVVLLARLAGQLEEAGYRVLRASTISEGEHLVAEEQPALILIDPTTQKGAGWKLIERLAPRMPLIAISGAGLEEDVVRGLDLGAADYLAKPFRTAELLARLRRALRGPVEDAPDVSAQTTFPTTTDPVDRLRRSSVEQQAPIDTGARRKGREPLGERRIETPMPVRKAKDEEEPVFISAEEEHQLFTQAETRADDMRLDEINQLPLGKRLKSARQRRRITLVQAELDTKLRMYYIQAMEEEKFALLPSGPTSEQMLRDYASYLGLDLGAALGEYRERHFNTPIVPPLALGGSPPPRQIPRWIVPLLATILALSIGIGGIWLVDPGFLATLPDRARILIVAPTPTSVPTSVPTTAPTATLLPSATVTPSPTITATRTATPTSLPTVVLTPSATSRPQP